MLREKLHQLDFCVVGGGLAGLCAAVAAARHGAKTALIQDRPVLGGNASSEIRMWVCGARGENMLETGLIEEIQLENLYRNKYPCYSIWDSVLYEKAKFQENLELILNCSVNEAEMDGSRIKSVRGWQLTTQTFHVVEADLFADCSGDSILAPLTGAEVRWGRESNKEFGEDIQPDEADSNTMGNTCLIQLRELDHPVPFIPPSWAYKYENAAAMPPHRRGSFKGNNFWYLEVGGTQDTIHDGEELRDELVKIAFGVWDFYKNHSEYDAGNWTLDWMSFLPGKRENRRFVGDYIMNQNDVRADGRFDDLVAYGGWPMDDHHPDGFYSGENKPTIFHPAPSPFGISYRCLYSNNIENLFMAGRNISVTHAALSATRVMATTATLGHAVGVAAAVAAKHGLMPRGAGEKKIDEIQHGLMEDDAYLPWKKRPIPELTQKAKVSASAGDPEELRTGVDRPIGEAGNVWSVPLSGAWAQYEWDKPQCITQARFVFDSNLARAVQGHAKNMPCQYPLDLPINEVPGTMLKRFRIEAKDDSGQWQVAAHVEGNYQRLVYVDLDVQTTAVRFVPEETWGGDTARVQAWDVR
ncbi:FAD-dependent oxidoreductase [bacterium]|nr:FAD-dependent oxidoreductase [bacterium]